jgi:hypothetical protein
MIKMWSGSQWIVEEIKQKGFGRDIRSGGRASKSKPLMFADKK